MPLEFLHKLIEHTGKVGMMKFVVSSKTAFDQDFDSFAMKFLAFGQNYAKLKAHLQRPMTCERSLFYLMRLK